MIDMSEKFDEAKILKAMVDFEGFTIEEAKLSYASRQNLPAGAFCGPDRTYPAHDAPHIRAAIQRLFQFKPSGWRKILSCVCGRAKKAGIESDKCKAAGLGGFSEAKILAWYLEKNKETCAEC